MPAGGDPQAPLEQLPAGAGYMDMLTAFSIGAANVAVLGAIADETQPRERQSASMTARAARAQRPHHRSSALHRPELFS